MRITSAVKNASRNFDLDSAHVHTIMDDLIEINCV